MEPPHRGKIEEPLPLQLSPDCISESYRLQAGGVGAEKPVEISLGRAPQK
jgi:hypothetical protein